MWHFGLVDDDAVEALEAYVAAARRMAESARRDAERATLRANALTEAWENAEQLAERLKIDRNRKLGVT